MAGFSLAFAFGLLGNIVSFGVFLAPLPAFLKIYKKKSAEDFQSIPYVIALFSAMLWLYYAFLRPNTLLTTINSVGCVIETFYICFYLFYASKKPKRDTLKLIALFIVGGFSVIVVVTHFLVSVPNRAVVVGWICLVFSLCVFVAPLCIVRQVIRTKSVEYMPFLLSVSLTLSAVMWFFYGLLLKDFNIAIPNVLGFVFGILQMILYAIYKNAKKEDNQKLAELPDHVIILDEPHKMPELTEEQVLGIVKLGSIIFSDKKVSAPKGEINEVETPRLKCEPYQVVEV